jgi:serine protease Do
VGESQLILQFPSGEITNIESIPLPQGYAISYDATSVRGMSGGAVVNSKGEVIAIHGKTDLDIITLASNQGNTLSPEQQEKVAEINNRVDSIAQINHFKWGIPINSFKNNFKDKHLVAHSTSSPAPNVNLTPEITPTPEVKSTIKNEFTLVTDRADFTRLNDLLKAGEWKEADQETWELIKQVTNSKERDYLEIEDYQNFPVNELRIMDQLWVKYSNGKFGFSVQKEIWLKNGGKLNGESDYDTYEKQAEALG